MAAFPVKNAQAGWLCRLLKTCSEESAEIGAMIAMPYADPKYQMTDIEDMEQNNRYQIVGEIAFAKTSSPIENFDQWEEYEANTEKSITVYTIKKGDNLYDIADYFGISLNTILWANSNLSGKNPVIRPGNKLTILPISGVQHKVRKGQTLSWIARKYFKSNEYNEGLKDIMEFNGLDENGFIAAGQVLIIPGGKMPATRQIRRAYPARKRIVNKIRDLADYFGWPIPSAVIKFTRRYEPHLRYGVDMGSRIDNVSCLNPDGSKTPIFAAADGIVTTVVQSRSRWRGGYGNYIVIKHPNNTVTYYAHLYYGSLLVKRGEQVLRGQQIASMGGGFDRGGRMRGAGTSTGCHLHFEVRGAVNPFVAIRKRYP